MSDKNKTAAESCGGAAEPEWSAAWRASEDDALASGLTRASDTGSSVPSSECGVDGGSGDSGMLACAAPKMDGSSRVHSSSKTPAAVLRGNMT